MGQRAKRHRAVLLHGPRLDPGPERRAPSILLYGRDSSYRLFKSESGPASRQGTGRIRRQEAETVFVAGDEPGHRRSAGVLHVAAQAALGLEQARRLQTLARRADIRRRNESRKKMTRPTN